ncbi:MAG: glyoxalase [Pseudonocardia sp. SCN 72-86]|nr:MAG: glyoxalase [Pseudonocardia sp. SCN 72-86]
MTSPGNGRPPMGGVHHFSPTVTDVEASSEWYQRILGLQKIARAPHHKSEESGYAEILVDMAAGIMIGLHHHDGNDGGAADERRAGLDHIAFGVPERADLDNWAAWLDENGVPHDGVTDATDPLPYSVLVFRDPDNIQLEMMWMAAP